MPSLTPLPGRALLRFAKPPEKSIGGIEIPTTSRQRAEIGEVVALGEPTNDKERAVASAIAVGDRIPVSYGAGVCFWKKEYGSNDAWLADLRLYPISELAAKVIE